MRLFVCAAFAPPLLLQCVLPATLARPSNPPDVSVRTQLEIMLSKSTLLGRLASARIGFRCCKSVRVIILAVGAFLFSTVGPRLGLRERYLNINIILGFIQFYQNKQTVTLNKRTEWTLKRKIMGGGNGWRLDERAGWVRRRLLQWANQPPSERAEPTRAHGQRCNVPKGGTVNVSHPPSLALSGRL